MKLYFEEYGTGDPLLFIHGLGGSTYEWRYIAPALSKRHRVVLVDLKGFGRSPKPFDSAYSLYDHAELVAALIKRLKLQNITLVGHSLGGGVALATVLSLMDSEPGRVRRLIHVNGIAYGQKHPPYWAILKLPLVGRRLGRLALALMPSEMEVRVVLMAAFHDIAKISEEAVTEYAKPLSTREGRYGVVETAAALLEMDVGRLSDRYGDINVPTLVITGTDDKIVPPDVARRLAAGIPGARLAVIPDGGHMPNEETPEVLLKLMEKFLAKG